MARGPETSGFVLPHSSQFRSHGAYLRAYNSAYQVLVQRIIQAHLQVGSAVKDLLRNDRYLGWFELYLLADEGARPLSRQEVTPQIRTYPESWLEEKVVKLVPKRQINKLILDLQSLRVKPHTMDHYGEKDRVFISHRVIIEGDNPLEDLLLQYHRNPSYYTILSKPEAVFDPKALDDPSSIDYKANHILTAFDRTKSGSIIPVGYNRLALLCAASQALDKKIRGMNTRLKPKS